MRAVGAPAPHEPLFSAGDPAAWMYVLLEGVIQARRDSLGAGPPAARMRALDGGGVLPPARPPAAPRPAGGRRAGGPRGRGRGERDAPVLAHDAVRGHRAGHGADAG